MPFLEILAPPVLDDIRQRIAATATAAVCEALVVPPETVTLYFLDIEGHAYAHAGRLGGTTAQRIFLKLHAYRRDVAARRRAAAALASPLAGLYGQPVDTVIVYFFDRAPDEVSHGGILSSDMAKG